MSRRAITFFDVTDSLVKRFFSHVKKTEGCWVWQGSNGLDGYGCFSFGDRNTGAHRASWIIHTKEPIPAGLWVLHKCDNPSCVNPDHLFLGTRSDNMKDAFSKGRLPTVRKPTGKAKHKLSMVDRLKVNIANRGPNELPFGVRKKGNRFEVRIVIKKRRISLGCFDSAEEAHEAYLKAAKEHLGIDL